MKNENTKLINKVPELTIYFWVIKIMATTVGETGADYLTYHLKLGLIVTTLIMLVFLAFSLFLQFKSTRYTPWIYWLAVVFISVCGTLVTDILTDKYKMPLIYSTSVFSVALILSFLAWYLSEKTLSIHTIYSTKREFFYWSVILFTFALGTAAGDLVSEDYNVGYKLSAILFGALIIAVTIMYYSFKLNAILSFWIAYILTRPFGASCGDLLTHSHKHGGLGLGTTNTSIVFFIIIICLVIRLTSIENKKINILSSS